MRFVLSILVVSLLPFLSYSQELSLNEHQDNLFVQVVLEDSDESSYAEIESNLRSNPYVFMVRLDRNSKGLFVVTKDLQSINRNVFNSWMGGYESSIHCYRQGIHGVHEVLPFNENFCSLIEE
jgi:hypothetical protein